VDIYELNITGERIMNLRQAFNLREGLNQLNFKVPGRIIGKPPLSDGKTKGIVLDYDNMVMEFYKEMDWDLKTSKPSKTKLSELDLDWLVKELK
jgi:aldehyde:ferredoxin oxidoreductase